MMDKELRIHNPHVSMITYSGFRDTASLFRCNRSDKKFYSSFDSVVGKEDRISFCPYCYRKDVINLFADADITVSVADDFDAPQYNVEQGITLHSPNFHWVIESYSGNNSNIEKYVGYEYEASLSMGCSINGNKNTIIPELCFELYNLPQITGNLTDFKYAGATYNLQKVSDREKLKQKQIDDGADLHSIYKGKITTKSQPKNK